MFERVCSSVLYNGVSIYFAESMASVARDLLRVRPTIMTGVPRAWEKFYQAIQDGLKALGGPRKKLADWGIGVGYDYAKLWLSGGKIPVSLRLKRAVADRLVFAKIRQHVGDGFASWCQAARRCPPRSASSSSPSTCRFSRPTG